jgi:hypothetical protein
MQSLFPRVIMLRMNRAQFGWKIGVVVGVVVFGLAGPRPVRAGGNTLASVVRPLRYTPDGGDFVITNGPEYFNRPLYANNSAFRVDGGDRPQFSMYVPGRGGNVRLGIQSGGKSVWLDEAGTIVARYRPGSMVYHVTDASLGGGAIDITAIPLSGRQGFIVRVDRAGMDGAVNAVKLIWAYGGANGDRGSRDGDIGTEREPVTRFFQLLPAYCTGDKFSIVGGGFTMVSTGATIDAVSTAGTTWATADARQWNSAAGLLGSIGQAGADPVIVGQVDLAAGASAYVALEHRVKAGETPVDLQTYRDLGPVTTAPSPTTLSAPALPLLAMTAENLPALFNLAERHRESVADKIIVDTPDPFINSAAGALCVAGDAVWDDQSGVFMHGAVAWRTKLIGWRGPYLADALGWHDRAELYFTNWAAHQNKSAIPDLLPGADLSANLARNEAALHSNGDLSNNHYDMNLVYFDNLFRHMLWTGDVEFARKMWPAIEAHLAWERRLFRRTYGPDHLPLYEAYCCIWASDDLEYDGGGAAHSSAYNYFENMMAARVATMIGKDPTPYNTEAGLILKAMHTELWLDDQGIYAEYRDVLGEQLAHASPAVWTFYHTVDSRVTTPIQAWRMSRFVDMQIAHIPLHGPGVPAGDWFTVATTNWMPYTWSTNNVVMAESAHTALAYWQSGRDDVAYDLFKGCLLDSMYMGLCPGNAGMCTTFDVARGESQRDFGDAVGTSSRALVEGLFGMQPDAMAGELTIRPGFPADWGHASLRHANIDFSYLRNGDQETFHVTPRFAKAMTLRLQIVARKDGIGSVTVNGHPGQWTNLDDSVGTPRIEIKAPAGPGFDVVVNWTGNVPDAASRRALTIGIASAPNETIRVGSALPLLPSVAVPPSFAVQQGSLSWQVVIPNNTMYEFFASENQDATHVRFHLRNNTSTAVDETAAITLNGQSISRRIQIPSSGESDEIVLDSAGIFPGSIPVTVDLAKRAVSGTVVNWQLPAPADAKFETVDLSKSFNDRVTQIFKNKYLSPRSTGDSLAEPTQGIGSWARPTATFNVDDSGLRRVAARDGGKLVLPDHVPLATPGDAAAKNILFTSQFDNYPHAATVPLSGKASHAYLLMAGSTNWMQSRIVNATVTVTYTDGTSDTLDLTNPTNWWPIDQDYVIDDYQFKRPEPLPIRVDLRTGDVRVLDMATYRASERPGRGSNITVNGGAATVEDLPLRADKELKSLTLATHTNEVVIGLMSVTLAR